MVTGSIAKGAPKRKRRTRRRGAVRRRREQARGRRARRRKRSRPGGPRKSVLEKMLRPVREAIGEAIDEEYARRWFPVLSMVAVVMCGLLYHVFGLSSLRAVVDKAKYMPALGLQGVRRSTLSDALNSNLRLRVLRKVHQKLVLRFSEDLPRHMNRFRHLAAIDSSVLQCAPTQLWAEYRKTGNACKAHVCFDISNGIPEQLALSAARVHDRKYFELFLKPGWTYLVDRAYNDYSLFDAMKDLDIFFVTRMKSNAACRVVERRHVKRTHRTRGVISDCIVRLGSGSTEMQNNLRLVTVRCEDDDVMEFLTNRFDLAPTSIAGLYRARWAIELFFKFLKRTLRGVRLIARSEIGAEMHILLGLITDILLKCLAKAAGCWRTARRHVPAQFVRIVRERLFSQWTQSFEAILASTFT